MLRTSFSLIILFVLLCNCKDTEQVMLNIPFSKDDIKVDGVIDDSEWKHGALLKNLISPWNDDNVDKTKFYAFVSNKYFNFGFKVEDNTPVTFPFESEKTVIKEDRVELFFSEDASLKKYYCIEIDPFGNALDYSAKLYRDFDDTWNFSEIDIKTNVADFKYTVEGRIPLNKLKSLGISHQFYFGVFRADFKSHKANDVCWISWIKPNSPKPDFHIPSAFALTSFSKEK